MPRLRIDFFVLLAVALLLFVFAENWVPIEDARVARPLAEIKRSGELVVLTQNSPTTYFLDRDGREAGFEYELIKSFADYHGLTPRFVIKDTVNELLDGIEAGEGDLAAAGLSVTRQRQERFIFGPGYQEVSQQVVCRRGGPRPREPSQLVGVDLVIISGTSYEERLKQLQVEHPELTWETIEGVGSDQLLEQIWKREIECTVMDSTIAAINQRYFPELRVLFDLGERDDIAWVMPRDAGNLKESAFEWLNFYERNGHLDSLYERYFGHVELFDYVDTAAFKRRIAKRYPRYQPLFKAAAEQYGLSEYLLAAQAYQESHWNPRARSPTGVRGIMMLTLPTAKAMGVTSRLNAEQNIFGGARYLAKLKRQLSKTIKEPDLTWFALAAYNVGLGHLRDAQSLAQRMQKNPLLWHDLKEVLPLLSDPTFYKSLRYGYARGWEPVRYVQQVREYEHILIQQLAPDMPEDSAEPSGPEEPGLPNEPEQASENLAQARAQ